MASSQAGTLNRSASGTLARSASGTLGRSASGTLTKRGPEKTDTLMGKMGTLGKNKKKAAAAQAAMEEAEAERVDFEGRYAIDCNTVLLPPEINPEDCHLEEGEERYMVAPESREDPKVLHIIKLLIDWVNDELASQRIVVRDIEEDFFDGQVIQKLLEKLTGVKIEVPEVSQSEEGQKQKLQVVLQYCDKIMSQSSWQSQRKWSTDSIHSKSLVAILHLLVALAVHFRAPIRFPEHCSVNILVVRKQEGQLRSRYLLEEITKTQEEFGLRGERDAFDTLFDHAPDKLSTVKKSLIAFVNKHLNKINLEVTDLDTQFHDGVYLVLLMGLLEGYFVPLYCFHLTPNGFSQRVENVALSFQLMQDAGLGKPKSRPEDIVNQDLKCTLRVVYNLFTKYKHV